MSLAVSDYEVATLGQIFTPPAVVRVIVDGIDGRVRALVQANGWQ